MIKYRVYCPLRGEMIQDDVYMAPDGTLLCKNVDSGGLYERHAVPMLSTGIEDKNGKEIYEGDVISIRGNGRFRVRFEHGVCYTHYMRYSTLMKGMSNNYEVLGNIYEHTDLLRKGTR